MRDAMSAKSFWFVLALLVLVLLLAVSGTINFSQEGLLTQALGASPTGSGVAAHDNVPAQSATGSHAPEPALRAGSVNLYLPLVASLPPDMPPDETATPSASSTPALPTATPSASSTPASSPVVSTWWKPTPDAPMHWHWQLSETFVYTRDVLPNVTVYDLDGELTSAETVAQLHALGPNVKVICYMDAGVYETYRSDASRFPPSVIGNPDEGWPGSYWLDIRQTEILLPIMRDRMQHWCKDKGFDAVEPDETEVWSNNPGFPITLAENNAYNIQIAALAHELGLSVGLKGNASAAPTLWPYFDWTLNEQCWEYSECDSLKNSFLANGKAVMNIEYNVDPDCAAANVWHMNSARRDLDLVGRANPAYRYTPCVPDSQDSW
jgi:hypothetical protein